MVKIQCFQSRGPQFNVWSENKDPTYHRVQTKKKITSLLTEQAFHWWELRFQGSSSGNMTELGLPRALVLKVWFGA